jgi:putative nucleotidyltransferase with HDIG domain
MADLPVKAKLFIAITAITAIAVIVSLLLGNPYSFSFFDFIFFAVLIFLTENLTVDLPQAGAVSVTFIVIMATVVIYGPLFAGLTSLFTAVVWRDIKRHTSAFRWVFNASQHALSSSMAGLAYVWTGGPVFSVAGHGFARGDFPHVLIPIALLVFTFYFFNSMLVMTVISLAEKQRLSTIWFQNIRGIIPNTLAFSPIGLAFAEIFQVAGFLGGLLIIAPLLIARQTFQIYVRLRKAYFDTIDSLVAALEAKDSYTSGHSKRVGVLAEKVGRELRLSEADLEILRYAGLLHDIGKIGTSSRILKKPGKLTQSEYKAMKQHPEFGALILQDIKFMERVIPAVFHHHERVDGSGYADGIKGSDIPLLAKILAAVDAFDAMTSPRPYRATMRPIEACNELRRCSGSQFDSRVVDVLVEIIKAQEESKKQARKEELVK